MADKQMIDVTKCIHFDKSSIPNGCTCYWDGECNHYCYFKQLKRKEQECEELHNRTASIIYNLTGGRLSYSTYTLEGCEDAYRDQLSIDVERVTKELQAENDKYKQALDGIEKIISEEVITWAEVDKMTTQILNIISKAKK